jgi:hypothetical protein
MNDKKSIEIVNKINFNYLSDNDKTCIGNKLVRSDKLTDYNRIVKGIIFHEIVKLNNDLIDIILSYFEEPPINFFYNNQSVYPHHMIGIFSGKYVNIFISFDDEGYGSAYYTGYVNVKKDIGKYVCYDRNILVNSNKLLTGELIIDDMYGYGHICSGRITREYNNFNNDLNKLLHGFKKIKQDFDWITQIRQGKDIMKGTHFQDILDKNPNDYFFVSYSMEQKKGYLVKLSEYEYEGLINEMKEINEIFSLY